VRSTPPARSDARDPRPSAPALTSGASGRVRPTRARPKPGRPKGEFTQHRRLDRLREILDGEPRGLTLAEIAALLRVTPRSVRRYLRELDGTGEGDDLDILESVATGPGGAHRWRIKPGERGRAVPLRRAQAYAVLATRRALDVLRGSALFDEVDLALGLIAKVAQTPYRAQGRAQISGERSLEDRFFFLPGAARSYTARGEDVDELFRAVADLRVLRFRPRARAGEPRADRLVFHPYAMVVHKGALMVLGAQAGASPRQASEGAEAVVVAFDTMTEIRASETEHFVLPESFDVNDYVHGEFGVASPGALGPRAIVEFDARVGDEIRARKWHKDQRTATSPDGRVRLSVPVVSPDAFASWVLSFGDAARVVEPPDVVRHVAEVLERAAQRYR